MKRYDKVYVVEEAVGNFSVDRLRTDFFDEAQDYIFDRMYEDIGADADEIEQELYLSYFNIREEKVYTDDGAYCEYDPTNIYIDGETLAEMLENEPVMI